MQVCQQRIMQTCLKRLGPGIRAKRPGCLTLRGARPARYRITEVCRLLVRQTSHDEAEDLEVGAARWFPRRGAARGNRYGNCCTSAASARANRWRTGVAHSLVVPGYCGRDMDGHRDCLSVRRIDNVRLSGWRALRAEESRSWYSGRRRNYRHGHIHWALVRWTCRVTGEAAFQLRTVSPPSACVLVAERLAGTGAA